MFEDSWEESDYALDFNQGTANGPQYVTFRLGEEEYGIEIMRVQEIIGYRGFTQLPNVAQYIKGILNLRGAMVPVIDLRVKLTMEPRPYDKFTVIIIIEVRGRVMGLIVDAVSDVVGLHDDAIEPMPSFSSTAQADFILSMAEKGDKLIVLLDIDRILSDKELAQVDASA